MRWVEEEVVEREMGRNGRIDLTPERWWSSIDWRDGGREKREERVGTLNLKEGGWDTLKYVWDSCISSYGTYIYNIIAKDLKLPQERKRIFKAAYQSLSDFAWYIYI
jgi:hypothetical protein